jgi:hypothetical protein
MHLNQRLRSAFLAACLGVAAFSAAHARGTLDDVSWSNFNGPGGPSVEFRLTFGNPDGTPSEPLQGTVNAQEFGAFLPDVALICEFTVPSMPPGGTHVVVCTVELEDLPPAPPRFDEAGNYLIIPGGPPAPPGTPGVLVGDCPVVDFWAGGIDVIWTGDGGGQAIVHRGLLPVCARAGAISYIRLEMDCGSAGGVSWSFSNLCSGWSANLVNAQYGQAPNPLPPGPFTGYVEVFTTQNQGAVCDFDMNLLCGDATGTIHVTGEVCDCERPVAVEPATWGRIKATYPR